MFVCSVQTRNTTSNISHAPFAQLSLVHKIRITSIKTTSIAIITTPLASQPNALDAAAPSLNNMSKLIEIHGMNAGIQSAI